MGTRLIPVGGRVDWITAQPPFFLSRIHSSTPGAAQLSAAVGGGLCAPHPAGGGRVSHRTVPHLRQDVQS